MKIIMDSVVKPAWKLLFTIPLEIVGVVTFFYPDLKINRITITDIMPWYWWVITGLLVLLVGIPIEYEKLIKAKRDKKDDIALVKISSKHQSGGQTAQTIINITDANKERDLFLKTPRLRLEPVRELGENLVGIRVYNDENLDFTDIKAELIGVGFQKEDGRILNHFDNIRLENRDLSWFDDEQKIGYLSHDLIRILTVGFDGITFFLKKSGMVIEHNSDNQEIKIGIEIRGRLGQDPIIPKRCCVSFSVRKDIVNDKQVRWAVTMPTLEEVDCLYEKTIDIKEYLLKK